MARRPIVDENLKDIKDPMEILFISFVSMLYNSGIQQLGKIMNPITGKVHKDLAGVHSTIEILKMMQAKTKGNLSSQEKSVIESSISNLQINYVEEMDQQKKKKEAVEDSASEKAEADEKKDQDEA